MAEHPQKAYFDDSWTVCEGVEDLGFAYSTDRVFPGSTPAVKTSGIKGRRGNPTNQQLQFTGGVGIPVKVTDQIWTIWESTFRPDGETIKAMPQQGDIFKVVEVDSSGDPVSPINVLERWIVQWSKPTLYNAQYLCYCTESPLNQDQVGHRN